MTKFHLSITQQLTLFIVTNGHAIRLAAGAEFLCFFKVWQQAHRNLRHCFHVREYRLKGKRIIKFISSTFLSAVIFTSTACSIKTLYGHLDVLIPYYLEGMVTLNDQLEVKVEQRAVMFMRWHRGTQLMHYADWLQTIKKDVENGVTKVQLNQAIDAFKSFWDTLLFKMNEEMVQLLPLLNAQQRAELFASINDKNDDFREDYIDVNDEQRIEQYNELMLENYENWLGDLTDTQEKQIKRAASQIQSSARQRLQRRLLWQKKIQHIINTDESKQNKSQKLRLFFHDFDLSSDPDIDEIVESNKRILVDLTFDILLQINPDQKHYFVSKLDDYIRMMLDLSADPKP